MQLYKLLTQTKKPGNSDYTFTMVSENQIKITT